MCEIGEGDPPEMYSFRDVKAARKAHLCSACGGAVRPGQPYRVNFWVQDGDHYTEKECPACRAIGIEFGRAHGDVGVAPSYLREALQECLADGEDSERWREHIAAMDARRAAAVATP